MSNLVGTLFHDRYEVLEVLGSGGTSVVYKAKDILLNRLVTIKILREQFARDSKFVNRSVMRRRLWLVFLIQTLSAFMM